MAINLQRSPFRVTRGLQVLSHSALPGKDQHKAKLTSRALRMTVSPADPSCCCYQLQKHTSGWHSEELPETDWERSFPQNLSVPAGGGTDPRSTPGRLQQLGSSRGAAPPRWHPSAPLHPAGGGSVPGPGEMWGWQPQMGVPRLPAPVPRADGWLHDKRP